MSRFNLINKTCIFIASSAMLLVSCGGGGGGTDTDEGDDSTPLRSWGTAELIETDNAGEAVFPNIAVDITGNAIAVWQQDDGTQKRTNILANYYTVDGGWGSVELVESIAGFSLRPSIAIDDFGNVYVAWAHFDGTNYNIWANIYNPSSGWGVAESIDVDNVGRISAPKITINSNGSVLVVWNRDDSSERRNLWANHYNNRINSLTGQPFGWGTSELIETGTGGISDARSPQIASDTLGNAIAVWEQSDGIGNSIWANRYTTDSGWGTATLIETNSDGGAFIPQIAFDATGNATAIWIQSDGIAQTDIWINRYTIGNGWGVAELIESEEGDSENPQIAITADGNAMATWEHHDGIRNNIMARRYTLDNGWDVAELVDTPSGGDSSNPQIAIDAFGNALVVWRQSDGALYRTWANRYIIGDGWGNAEVVEAVDGSNSRNQQIVIDTFGDALVVWQKDDGARFNIWANRFE